MKFTAITIAAAAIIVSVSLGTKEAFAQDAPAYDHTYSDSCVRAQQDNGAAGAVFGALTGAALGGAIAGHGHHTTGAIIGGLAGAVVGGDVGRSSAEQSDLCADPADARDDETDPAPGDQQAGFDDEGPGDADQGDDQ